MSNRKITKSPNHAVDKSIRITVHLPIEWKVAFEQLVTLRQSNLSEMYLTTLQFYLASLPRKESDLIRGTVHAVTGKTLRIDRTATDTKLDNVEAGEGETSTDNSVLRRINRIQDHAVDQPIAVALDSLYTST
jgi:hypothetical protein